MIFPFSLSQIDFKEEKHAMGLKSASTGPKIYNRLQFLEWAIFIIIYLQRVYESLSSSINRIMVRFDAPR